MKKEIKLLHIYPKEMNIYGDLGNVLAIKKRLEWRGIDCLVLEHHPGHTLNSEVDIIIGGGGQDSGQSKIQDDLLKNSEKLHQMADKKVPMLVICGLYQLFGNFFKTIDDKKLQGIGIFDAETYGVKERIVGNIVTKSQFGELVGYENHSGLTFLKNQQKPLGKVTKGVGNNTSNSHEGAVYRNVFGSYLHGSLLPKNPNLADAIIRLALHNKYGQSFLEEIDDNLERLAKNFAKKRPR